MKMYRVLAPDEIMQTGDDLYDSRGCYDGTIRQNAGLPVKNLLNGKRHIGSEIRREITPEYLIDGLEKIRLEIREMT